MSKRSLSLVSAERNAAWRSQVAEGRVVRYGDPAGSFDMTPRFHVFATAAEAAAAVADADDELVQLVTL